MKYTIFVDILLLIGVIYLFSMCSNGDRNIYNDNGTHSEYNINYYIDTIDNHIILVTVCDYPNTQNLSVSTLELK